MFDEVGRPEVCGMLWHPEALAACRDEGRLWVITAADDRPAGFLITDMVDGCVHVEQVSVDPGSARQGLGRALLDHAAERAATADVPALTLTTFADVPWNAPYYVRCGFRVLDDGEVTLGCGPYGSGKCPSGGPVAAGLHAPRLMTSAAASPKGGGRPSIRIKIRDASAGRPTHALIGKIATRRAHRPRHESAFARAQYGRVVQRSR
jgi:hypothetical protein